MKWSLWVKLVIQNSSRRVIYFLLSFLLFILVLILFYGQVRLLILPNLETYMQLLDPEMQLEKQKNELKRKEAWRVYGSLLVGLFFFYLLFYYTSHYICIQYQILSEYCRIRFVDYPRNQCLIQAKRKGDCFTYILNIS